MTVIAWDGTTLAADKRASNSGLARTVTKIRRARNGALMGCTGDLHAGEELMAWYDSGRAPEAYPASQKDLTDDLTTLVVIERGPVITTYGRHGARAVFEEKTYASGCGRDYAIAAMHYGKDARDAVALACLFDVGCGNGIDTLTLEQDQ